MARKINPDEEAEVTEFLQKLTKLTKEYKLIIGSCGSCGSIYFDLAHDDIENGFYYVSVDGDCFTYGTDKNLESDIEDNDNELKFLTGEIKE